MASLDDYGCRIGPGDGLAARFGGVVALVPAWQQRQHAVLDQILDVVERGGEQGAAGRLLCRQLASLLANVDPAVVPTFVALAAADDGLAVFVHGEIDVAVRRSGSEETVSGRHVATWVDRILDEPIDSIAVAPEGGHVADLGERLDLRAGVVSAGSLLLASRERVSSERSAVVDTSEGAARAKTTLDGGVEDVDELRSEVLAPSSSHAASPPEETTGAFRTIALRGVSLDEPRAPLPIGGEPPADQPAVAPPLGLLLFDDGTTFSLDSEVVVGREPESDSRVASGEAQPLVITDTERSVSRLHLRIAVHGDKVELVDLRSANGTAVRRTHESAWHPLTPGVATTIVPDTEVQLGNRTFVFAAQGRS
ncbi:MAG TPA: FHA domain-containing protein [Acidimicrobiales bacterium]